MSKSRFRSAALSAAGLLAAAGAAHAQSFTADFEAPAYTGSASGTILTGQNGWYLPSAGGLDHNVYTYAGNSLGIAANPQGGAQFEAGVGATTVARAQHDVDFSSGGTWEADFDVNGSFTGTPPTVEYLGSFSLQDSVTTRYFQQLMSWGSAGTVMPYPGGPTPTNWSTTADHFHIAFGFFTAASPTVITFQLASAAWMDLPTNHWYHVTVRWDFTAAQITQVSIRDITAGGTTTTDDVTALGWYLQGGPNSTFPLPTAVRDFAGGTGSITGWDNLHIFKVQTGPTCYANCDGSTINPFLNVNDFVCFQSRFAAGDSYANCDGSTVPPILNVNDFVCFQSRFAAGCSAP